LSNQQTINFEITLVSPPLSQLNTPYPAVSYLSKYLEKNGIHTQQRDLGLELMLRLLSKKGLAELFDELEERDELPEEAWAALATRSHHEEAVDVVVAYLQNKCASMTSRIASGAFLPQSPRVSVARLRPFGRMGQTDLARHLCTLYVEDLVDLVCATIDNGFQLSRYQHHLATSPKKFDEMEERLANTTIIDRWLDELAFTIDSPVVAITVPFPGNLYGALRIGRVLKQRGQTVYLGGGYINTELREVNEPRLWQYCDALTYDDGEGPLLALIQHRLGAKDTRHRTLTPEGRIDMPSGATEPTRAPYYGQLPLDRYLQLLDTLNPAHRLWSDGRWNKITLAHGCYWKRCAFCDVTLDYVGNYNAGDAVQLVDEMERLIEETGETGFHFVDEAAPPKVMKAMALEILSRGLKVTWWGNIRFETTFTPDLCRLLAASGLIAVTGGLEVASDRLLAKMDKGITLAETIQVTKAFANSGISTHAYLMYGFPNQTALETMNAMEFVRQMFLSGLLKSAFWHRFVLTRHSLVYKNPEEFGIKVIDSEPGAFASNDVLHTDNEEHDQFDKGLPLALASWLRGEGLNRNLSDWFDTDTPTPTLGSDFVTKEINKVRVRSHSGRLIWIGKGLLEAVGAVRLFGPLGEVEIQGSVEELEWLTEVILAATVETELHFEDVIDAFPGNWEQWSAQNWPSCVWIGLIVI
jgi:hypothetical protein